jgi:hypothetical protein
MVTVIGVGYVPELGAIWGGATGIMPMPEP